MVARAPTACFMPLTSAAGPPLATSRTPQMSSQIPENAHGTAKQMKYLLSKGFRILTIQYRKYDKVGVKFDIGTLWVKLCYIEHDFSI